MHLSVGCYIMLTPNHSLTPHRPICTYGRKGLSEKDLPKWQHSVIYSGKKEPGLLPGEAPGRGEYGFRQAIRVSPRDKHSQMDRTSRLHYAKMYTVEHNVKVFDFGMVLPEYIEVMKSQWREVLHHTPRTLSPANDVVSNYQLSNEPVHDQGSSSYMSTGSVLDSAEFSAGAYQYYGSTSTSYGASDTAFGGYQVSNILDSVEEDGAGEGGVEEEENVDDDTVEDDEEEDASEGPYVDYAVAKTSHRPSESERALHQIYIERGQRLGVVELGGSGWVTAWNPATNETGYVWREFLALDSEVPATAQ